MLRSDAKPDAKQAVQQMDTETFIYFIGELYARQGADVYIPDATQARGYDIILENTRFTPYDEQDTTAVKCLRTSQEKLSFEAFQNHLRPELQDEFDYYVLCTTADSLTRLARQKLEGKGYSDNWFDLQNLRFITNHLMEPHSPYLPLVYDEVSPKDYSDGWTSHDYLVDRFNFLGISVKDKLYPKIQASDTPLLFIEHTEKFALKEHFNISQSMYEFMQYDGYRPPEIIKELTRRVDVQNTNPNERLFDETIFE